MAWVRFTRARADCNRGSTRARLMQPTVEALARAAGIDPAGLLTTLAQYNRDARSRHRHPMGQGQHGT